MTRSTRSRSKRPKPTQGAKLIYHADDLGRRVRAAMREWSQGLSKRKREQIRRLSK